MALPTFRMLKLSCLSTFPVPSFVPSSPLFSYLSAAQDDLRTYADLTHYAITHTFAFIITVLYATVEYIQYLSSLVEQLSAQSQDTAATMSTSDESDGEPNLKQRYRIALPPRSATGRDKLLLQLQAVSYGGAPNEERVVPAFNIRQASGLSTFFTATKAYPRTRGESIVVDIVDKYQIDHPSLFMHTHRNVDFGCIYPLASNSTQGSTYHTVNIRLRNGCIWRAHQLPDGNFDLRAAFSRGPGAHARWVLRPRSAQPMTLKEATAQNNLFHFQIVNGHQQTPPTSATLDINELSVYRRPKHTFDSVSKDFNQEMRSLAILSAGWIRIRESNPELFPNYVGSDSGSSAKSSSIRKILTDFRSSLKRIHVPDLATSTRLATGRSHDSRQVINSASTDATAVSAVQSTDAKLQRTSDSDTAARPRKPTPGTTHQNSDEQQQGGLDGTGLGLGSGGHGGRRSFQSFLSVCKMKRKPKKRTKDV